MTLPGDQVPPEFRHPGEIQARRLGHGQPFTSVAFVLQQKAPRLLESCVLCGSPYRDVPEHPEQGGTMALVEAPEEREVVVAGVG